MWYKEGYEHKEGLVGVIKMQTPRSLVTYLEKQKVMGFFKKKKGGVRICFI